MRQPWIVRLIIPLLFYFGSRVVLNRTENAPQTQQPTSPITAPQTAVSQSSAPSTQKLRHPSTAQIETEIHAQINTYRQSRGLSPLELDYRIIDESRKFSGKMASGAAEFSHDGFDQRAENLEKKALKYASVGENLALLQGYEDLATTAVEGWIDSPGHHENIIGDYHLTGIGVVKNEEGVYYFTQLFLKRQ
ncbi:SCP-like extracellular [[Leptolyngbya] sp. PCC 7376]|uniref:CAP domain-containing protein n=1 Tax=[Leptolyngbya] sp. PCC 7376 TaxID=111781 RepID=UPI00029EE4FC|nr:CAP domain-containing protein [[Leptolyngbya] sp. PCC 7376]AFY40531.1 SCP-like extracellular [[Leptolyngbya] sp. PCC 7376]